MPPRRSDKTVRNEQEVTIPQPVNRGTLRTKGNNRHTEANRTTTQTKHPLDAAAAVCGTSSTERFYFLLQPVWLAPCYPVCRLLPAFVKRVPLPGKMRQAIQNKQSRLGSRDPLTGQAFFNKVKEGRNISRKKENQGGSKAQREERVKKRKKERPRSTQLVAAVGRTSSTDISTS